MKKSEFAKELIAAWWKDRARQSNAIADYNKMYDVMAAEPKDLKKDIKHIRDILTDALEEIE